MFYPELTWLTMMKHKAKQSQMVRRNRENSFLAKHDIYIELELEGMAVCIMKIGHRLQYCRFTETYFLRDVLGPIKTPRD